MSSRPNSPFRHPTNSRPASRGGFLPKELLDEEERKTSMPQHVRGTVEPDEEVAIEKYYKPHFLQMPPAEVVVQEGKFFRLDAKVSSILKKLEISSVFLVFFPFSYPYLINS